MTPQMVEHLYSWRRYVDALNKNIQNRFDGNLEVLTAFKVLNPTTVPKEAQLTLSSVA